MHLTVEDTGTGMPPSVAAQAFDPFFTTKPRGQGTGLGLASVFGIVSQAGGAVKIDSKLGEGTTVSIWLPAAEGSPPTDDASADSPSGTERRSWWWKTRSGGALTSGF